MNLALDTNVIVYALAGTEQTARASSQALEDAASRGGALVVAAPVYAELLGIPHSKKEDLDAFIADAKSLVDWHISKSCWIGAGIAFAAYARRRNRQKVSSPRRILADFIIGAHAAEVGGVLTADAAFYRTNFPELHVIEL